MLKNNLSFNIGAAMNRILSLSLALGIALVVSACCSEEGQQRAGAVDMKAANSPPATTAESKRDDSVPGMSLVYTAVDGLVLEPKVEKISCKDNFGDVGEVRVKWTAPSGVNAIRISAAAAGQDAKTWVDGGGSGDEVTGAWISSGATLSVYNAFTKAKLGEIKVEATPCATK